MAENTKKEVKPTEKRSVPKKLSFIEAIKAKDFDTVKSMATEAAKEHMQESMGHFDEDFKNLKAHPMAQKLMKKVEEIKNK